MSLKQFVLLLTCCSLVLASLPQHVSAKSDKAMGTLQSFSLQLDDVATTSVASATVASTIVDDHAIDSLEVACSPIQYGQTVSGFPFGEDECFTFSGQIGDNLNIPSPAGGRYYA